MKGQQVCMMHGGKSRKGLAHPNIKDGTHADPRYLGVLSPRLAESFKEIEKHPQRHSLDDEITLLAVRARDILREIETGEYVSRSDLLTMAEEVIKAQVERERDRALTAWQKLMDSLRRGHAQEKGWREFDELAWKRKPYLLEKEAKRRVLHQEMYQRNVVIQLLQALAASVKRNVTNNDEADAIYKDIIRLSGGTDGVGIISGRTSQTGH